MFCDLSVIKTVQDLRKKIKTRFDLKRFDLILDDAILPKDEPIAILHSGDIVTVKLTGRQHSSTCSEDAPAAKKSKINCPKPSSQNPSEPASTSSSSIDSGPSTSSDELGDGFEKPFKQKNLKIQSLPITKIENQNGDDAENKKDVALEKKKKRTRRAKKNKNKNKLPECLIPNIPTPPAVNGFQKVVPESVPRGKIIKFSDHEDADLQQSPLMEKPRQRLEPSSASISCEEILLGKPPENGIKKPVANGLENLLRLAENPKVVKKGQKMASKDVCENKSVILSNASASANHDFGDLDRYEAFGSDSVPEIGQIFAFKSLQIGPDYTPQVTQFIGELKHFVSKDDDVIFLILFDENEGKNRSEKFEIDDFIDGVTLRNREVEFKWSVINDIRKIK